MIKKALEGVLLFFVKLGWAYPDEINSIRDEILAAFYAGLELDSGKPVIDKVSSIKLESRKVDPGVAKRRVIQQRAKSGVLRRRGKYRLPLQMRGR